MKTFRFIGFALFTALLFLSACSSGDEETEPEIPIPAIQDWYAGDKINCTKDSKEVTFSFTANFNWTINIAITNGEGNWCVVNPQNGVAGNHSIQLKVTENKTYENRIATVSLVCKDEKKSIRIEQEGVPKPDKIVVEKAGTLKEKLSNIDANTESLIIEGEINGDDIEALRTLHLKTLDLLKVKIVKGGSFKYIKQMGVLGSETRKETCKEDNVIPNNMFNNGFRVLEELILPYSVTSIGDYAFEECISLKQIQLPPYAESIGEGAFTNCFELERLDLPGTLTSIGAGAFRQCNKLSGIVIPEGITIIEGSTFAQCRNIHYIILPKSLVEIAPMAFSECCWGLTEIKIPENVKKIGYQAFYKCDNLTYVTCFAETAPELNYIFADNKYIYPFDDGFRGYLFVSKIHEDSYIYSDWNKFFIIKNLED